MFFMYNVIAQMKRNKEPVALKHFKETGALVRLDNKRLVARIVYAKPKMAESMRKAAEDCLNG